MTAPTLFTSPFAVHRTAILASPALLQLVLNLHDALADSLDADLASSMTDTQRAIGTELIASHARYGDADVGFTLLATAAERALARVEREYGAMQWNCWRAAIAPL